MTGGAYVCFYSSISKGWLQGGACTFPVCLAKKLILEHTREPYSPAEHAILMFTKDRFLSKPGEHHGRCQHYFPAPGFAWFYSSFCHSMTIQLACSCTAWVPQPCEIWWQDLGQGLRFSLALSWQLRGGQSVSNCCSAGVTSDGLGEGRCPAAEVRYVPRCQPSHQGHFLYRLASLNLPKHARDSNGQAGGQTWCFQVSSHDIRRVPFLQ